MQAPGSASGAEGMVLRAMLMLVVSAFRALGDFYFCPETWCNVFMFHVYLYNQKRNYHQCDKVLLNAY